MDIKILPELGVEINEDNFQNIKEIIDGCIDNPSFVAGREKARSETWVHIGEGTKRSADYVLSKYNEVVKRKAAEAKKESKTASRKKGKTLLSGKSA